MAVVTPASPDTAALPEHPHKQSILMNRTRRNSRTQLPLIILPVCSDRQLPTKRLEINGQDVEWHSGLKWEARPTQIMLNCRYCSCLLSLKWRCFSNAMFCCFVSTGSFSCTFFLLLRSACPVSFFLESRFLMCSWYCYSLTPRYWQSWIFFFSLLSGNRGDRHIWTNWVFQKGNCEVNRNKVIKKSYIIVILLLVKDLIWNITCTCICYCTRR